MVLAGNLDRDDWPPQWPDEDGEGVDERQLARVVKRLDLDKSGYLDLCLEACMLATSRPFALLAAGYEALMEGGTVSNRRDIAHVKAITEKSMQRGVAHAEPSQRANARPVDEGAASHAARVLRRVKKGTGRGVVDTTFADVTWDYAGLQEVP